ncbi:MULTISPECIES: 4-oxalomesaconate tautomerase [unclassified Pseudomonas]|uniref:4-oxalomesaconate tautomerase n=1 Tax=unclassified Pseudomonas TaxID=196821 RepID=UPI00244B0557|nr:MULTISPECIES: 4-oxalomesaconate tautomerase [unclassified Pseudomonas]MDH0301714.1 4-oxalomesaconate tautomerase [Pseudomonas sp. GD04091]MDH1984933.1 4-oxalomesaconate tautomerase [Pseudomonas sp. GD03689]
MSQTRIPCLLMRGGTSKGAYFLRDDLPDDTAQRDRVLLAVMGSPDKRQIDGIGGGDSLTSKVAIVRPSRRADADVDYLFAQVVVDEARVDYGQNCGNILAGVGPFALERGLLAATGAVTPVRIFMENTGQLAVAQVPTPNGQVEYAGDTRIDGVPGTGAPLVVSFADIAGSSCGALLPTGNSRDRVDGLEVTCIDNGMPVILLRAEDLGLTGQESPETLDADDALKARLESIRLQMGPRMNLGYVNQRNVPKMCLVSAPCQGGTISTRSFIPHRCHASIGVFAAVSAATACLIEGSVTQGLAMTGSGDQQRLSVEHPSGEFSVEVRMRAGQIVGCGLVRTARLLFDGHVCIAAMS